MKVSYKIPGGGGYTVLFDESAGGPMLEEFQPSFKPINSAIPLYQGPAEFRESLLNVVCSLPLAFNISYTDRPTCLASIRTFAALVTTKVHLKVEQDTEVQYYPNALVEDYATRLMGAAARHEFKFQSDTVTTTAPV